MFLYSTKGKVIAELKFTEGLFNRSLGAQGKGESSALFRALKSIPREYLHVDVRYFGIGHDHFVPLTIYKGNTMDIEAALADHEVSLAEQQKEPRVGKMLFVAPASDKSPDDGVLTYSTIESVFDVAAVPDRSVVIFRADQIAMLKCFCENEGLFGLEMRVLTGLPETDYTADFDNATWSLDRVSYLPFLSELRLASEMESQLSAINETAYDREKAGYTRKTGLVKEHTKFDKVTANEPDADPADDSDLS